MPWLPSDADSTMRACRPRSRRRSVGTAWSPFAHFPHGRPRGVGGAWRRCQRLSAIKSAQVVFCEASKPIKMSQRAGSGAAGASRRRRRKRRSRPRDSGCHSWRVGALERRSAIALRFIPLPGRSRPDFARCQRQAAPPHPGCPWSGSTSRAAPLQTLAASPSIRGGANGGAGADLGAPGCAGPRRVRGSLPVPWPLRASAGARPGACASC